MNARPAGDEGGAPDSSATSADGSATPADGSATPADGSSASVQTDPLPCAPAAAPPAVAAAPMRDAGGAAHAPDAPTPAHDAGTVPARADVVVVGAGLAGLAAALTLAEAGLDACVLEAAERVGGRVRTVRAPFPDGLYAEAGGEFVDGGHQVLHDFLTRYRLPVVGIPGGARLFRFGGHVYRGEELADLGDAAARDDARLTEASARLAARVDDPARPWESAADLDTRSVGSWLDGLALGPLARAYQQVWRTVDYAAVPERLSLLQYARDERLWHDPAAPDDLPSGRVQGGMDRLPLAMAAELLGRVHLQTRVTALAHDGRGVDVHYQHAGWAGRLRAAFAVVAVPAPVLKQLPIDPPPEAPRRAAIEGLPSGQIVKVLLQARRRFWQDHGLTGRSFTDGLLQATYETTAGQPGERAILTVYTADWAAERLAALSDETRMAACLAELERLYPGCSAEIERAVTARWTPGTPAGGAYSYSGPGDVTRHGPRLARPIGRVHLAGEHTDPWQATMNGALASGLRAAREIVARAN